MKARDYEVSLWTIDDVYISTLKYNGAENKGRITKPIMKISTDGTQELSFSIPLYIYEDGQRIENPLWYHTRNGNILINMRKIKVCFNKESVNKSRWFEFLITEVKESHKGLQLTCDIKCEGLAFHELGRIGYKISLSADDFYDEDLKWFKGEIDEQPHATLQYWNNKFLPSEGQKNSEFSRWYYKIEMNWDAYEGGTKVLTAAASATGKRASNRVYEDSYIASYEETDGTLKPTEEIAYKEKERLVDISESNIYNITQKLAETFGVFCRYDYVHDSHGRIVYRQVVYYNNFAKENEGYIDFIYPYQTDDISRNIDSKDLITKMFVRPADDTTSPSGLITILDVGANLAKEDYIFNFDYLKKIGNFTDEHEVILKQHQKDLRQYNTNIATYANQILIYEEQLPKLKAQVTLYTNAQNLDKERLSNAQDLLNSLDTKDGDEDGYISIVPGNPRSAVLLEDKSDGAVANSYYIKLPDNGVNPDSIEIYRTVDLTKEKKEERLTKKITTGIGVFDEFNNLIKIKNLFKESESSSSVVYLLYKYKPKLYYDNVVATWTQRLEDDTRKSAAAQAKLTSIEQSLEKVRAQYEEAIANKQAAITNFELEFKGLIREGYWQPDDYTDYGDKYSAAWDLNLKTGVIKKDEQFASTDESDTSTDIKFANLLYNGDILIESEKDKLSYEIDVTLTKVGYPWIDLSEIIGIKEFQENIDKLNFIFPDSAYTTPPSTALGSEDTFGLVGYQVFSINSSCEYGFVKVNNTYKPALILTGVRTTNVTLTGLQYGQLGLLEFDSNETAKLKYTPIPSDATVGSLGIYHSGNLNDEIYQFVRIEISSLELKTSSDELSILLNGKALAEFEDYYITSTAEKKYITLKPNTLFKLYYDASNTQYKLNHKIKIRYTISNASTAIYLDAIEVLKENSKPKVSYTINPSVVDERFYYTAYNQLSRIINITDPELKFQNVQGYISSITLDLDAWWQDKIEVKNYKSKFEDLFSSIVASTEAMKKTEYTSGLTAGLFAGTGGDYLSSDIVKTTLRRVDLNYAFNHGTLTIDQENGIWGVSDSGVVAFRGGGIFTATERDANGGWIWNTGIVPQGINADLIVTGQLDTNKIRVYAGDRVRFQLNGDGLFGFKSFFEDFDLYPKDEAGEMDAPDNINEALRNAENDLDPAQYSVFNENGIFLIAKKNAYVLNQDRTKYLKIGNYHESFTTDEDGNLTEQEKLQKHLADIYAKRDVATPIEIEGIKMLANFPTEGIKRVSISWDGLILRNYNNERVFYADPDTGDLLIRGSIFADAFYVLSEEGATETTPATYTRYPFDKYLTVKFEDHVKVSEELGKIFTKAGEIIKTTLTSLTALDEITEENYGILKEFATKAKDLQAKVFYTSTRPTTFKPGDIWEPASGQYSGNRYIAMIYSDKAASTTQEPLGGWNKVIDGSIASITGAGMNVDAAAGTIDLYAGSKISLRAKSQLDLASGDIQITGNNSINIGSKWINIGSANGGINIISTDIDKDTTTDTNGKVNTTGTISKLLIDRDGIIMHSNKIELLAASGSTDVTAMRLDPNKGVWLGSTQEIRLFSASSVADETTGETTLTSSSNVLINSNKILFGVNSTGAATVAELTKEYIIFGAAGIKVNEGEDSPTDSENIANLRSNITDWVNGDVTGVKITSAGIYVAATAGNERGLVTIDPINIILGTATIDNTGSFVKIGKYGITVGSTSNMYINAANIGLDTTKGASGVEGVAFRLGPSTGASLVFANGNLEVTGAIHATSLFINDGNEETTIHGYMPKTFYQSAIPNSGYKEKDLWFDTVNFNTYIANKDYAAGATPANDWDKINKKIEGTKLTVDAEQGLISAQANNIDLWGGSSIVIRQGELSSSTQGIVMNGSGITVYSGAAITMDGSSINMSGSSSINLTSGQSKMAIAPNNIIIGTIDSNENFIQGIRLEKDKLVLTAGEVSLTGTTGFIQFQASGSSLPNFRVDEDGNVYCKSIVAEEGGTIGKETTTPSTSAQVITFTTQSFSLPTGYESTYANTVTFSASGFESGKTYTAIVTITASGGSGYLQHFNFKIGGVSQGDRSFPIWASKGPVTLNYTFTATGSSINGGIFMQLEQGSLSGTVVIDFYSNFNSGSSTEDTVAGGWSQGTGVASNSYSYTVTDENSNYKLNTVTVTGEWDINDQTFSVATDESKQLFSTSISGTWDINSQKYIVSETFNSSTAQLLETFVSGAWDTTGNTPVYKICPEDSEVVTLSSTALGWGSTSTYNNYPSNTYLADGVKSLTTIYGYQSGSTYYVKNNQGTTLFTDSVSATAEVEKYEYRVAGFSSPPSSSSSTTGVQNRLYVTATPTADLQRRESGSSTSYNYVSTYSASQSWNVIDIQKIKDIYNFLRIAKQITLWKSSSSNKALLNITIDNNDTDITYQYDLGFEPDDSDGTIVTRTFA